ncbi:hypothetical protein PROFUN_00884 [Planoprotostelium fungivorum]|uniref:6-phosphofructo-2-kinase domain-containing protein n=1 Tax=Planoprotostelium fungivorum TaxID=1890364 RepID=A0A2P6P0A0_9EUKA|nr:hypothetical protein PROFUN_00884 [Planoprotostelium fungivorum]
MAKKEEESSESEREPSEKDYGHATTTLKEISQLDMKLSWMSFSASHCRESQLASHRGTSKNMEDKMGVGQDIQSESSEWITIFFKVRDVVKKVRINRSNTMHDLRELFLEKYDGYRKKSSGYIAHNLPPFYIIDLQSKVSYELDDPKDLYPNCILELKLPSLDLIDKKETGWGYFSAFQRNKLVFAMVGLPARGKSFVARKITRYLKWMGVPTNLFNVGNYRRERVGAKQTSDFFAPDNQNGNRQRLHMAIAALDEKLMIADMLNWLNKGGRVAIYDATNTTKERRKMIFKRCTQENMQVVFIELIANNQKLVDKNVRETKTSSPDYVGQDPEVAVDDFRKRIQQYERAYEPIDTEESDYSYVKVIDVGEQIIINRIESYLPSRIIHFLMNLHITPRAIWLTRHGESEYNTQERIGGDSGLTHQGDEYAHALGDWVQNHDKHKDNFVVWTSTMKRSIATAQYINNHKVNLQALDEIDAGICDGMTYDEIASAMPEEYAARAANKLRYRYPHGESYVDVIQRLEPVLFEMEREKYPILIVAHQAVIRALYAYFMDIDAEECPYIPIAMHTVYELVPKAYGCNNIYNKSAVTSTLWAPLWHLR